MYIPLQALQSKQYFHSEDFSFHQNIAKALYKYSNKKPKYKLIKETEKKTSFYYQTQLQKDIYQWFFNLDLNSRIIICSIHNNWYINMLHQLSLLYFYEDNCTFKMINIDTFENMKLPDLNYYSTFFKKYEIQFIAMSQSRNELKNIDNEFYNQIRYITLNTITDTVTLKNTFLANQEKFMFYFNKLSSASFTLWIDVEYNEENKLYNFSQPQWVKDSQSISLSKIFLSLFEQVIQINYQYYYLYKKIYESPYYLKYNEIFETNDNIKQYLVKNDYKRIINAINVKELLKNIKNDVSIEIELNKIGNINNKVMEISNRKNTYLADKILQDNFVQQCIEQLKNKESIIELIDSLTWFDFISIFKYENIVNWAVLRVIKHKYSDSYVLDLIEEELKTHSSSPVKTKKKKKKKRRKMNQLQIKIIKKL